jgi:hypothetical protein
VVALLRAVAMRQRNHRPASSCTIALDRLLPADAGAAEHPSGGFSDTIVVRPALQRGIMANGRLMCWRGRLRAAISFTIVEHSACCALAPPACAIQRRYLLTKARILRRFLRIAGLHFCHIMVFADEIKMLNETENSTLATICEKMLIQRPIPAPAYHQAIRSRSPEWRSSSMWVWSPGNLIYRTGSVQFHT